MRALLRPATGCHAPPHVLAKIIALVCVATDRYACASCALPRRSPPSLASPIVAMLKSLPLVGPPRQARPGRALPGNG